MESPFQWNGVAHFQDFEGKKILVSRDLKCELHHPKKTMLGSIISNRIDYNRVGVLRGQHNIPSKN